MSAEADTFREPELIAGLRRWAQGSYRVEAAVELLIADGTWLRRAGLRRRAIWTAGGGDVDDLLFAGIDWDAAAGVLEEVPSSSGERAVLAIAISLVDGRQHPVDLGAALGSLDVSSSTRVLQAVAHAAGFHERHVKVAVNGRFGDRERGPRRW